MGVVAEAWRPPPQLNKNGGGGGLWKWWRSLLSGGGQHKRSVMWWKWVCGFMLFSLAVISLFTGHVVSHLEWAQQLSKRTLLVWYPPFFYLHWDQFLVLRFGYMFRIWAVRNQLMCGSQSILSSSMDAVTEEITSHVSVYYFPNWYLDSSWRKFVTLLRYTSKQIWLCPLFEFWS